MPPPQNPVPTLDDFNALQERKKKKTAGVRPALLWGAQREGHRHQGQDYGGKFDEDVGAADDGQVVFAGPNGNMGNTVAIRHPDGTVTRYGHLNRIDVQMNDQVKRGATIGL